MDIDLDDGRWPYQRLADVLSEGIASGKYRDGHQLPSRRQLMADYNLSGATVAHAVKVLESKGLVRSKHGVGVLVRRAPAGARWARAMVDWVGPDRAAFELGLALGLWPDGFTVDQIGERARVRRQLLTIVSAMAEVGLLEREESPCGERYRSASEEQTPGQMTMPMP